jgi:NAD(P)-dependent dehydrogenase (short-subunit alcohol dehydrogenase family)
MTTVLITGGNRGIGLALARRYAARGDRVIATARSPAEATDLAQVTKDVHRLDVTDTASHAALATALASLPIDILIANAGMMGPRGGMDDPANAAAIWAEVLATNVTGVFFTVRALAPNVIAAKGRIAILSSRMGSSARAAGSGYLYRASKAAAANIAANLAVELKPKGVSVAAYHPGWVKTDMGGSGADIGVEDSARGVMSRIDVLTVATTGAFEDYAGERIVF